MQVVLVFIEGAGPAPAVCAALAEGLAEAGRSVAVVGAGPLGLQIGEALGVRAAVCGVSDLTTGRCTPHEALVPGSPGARIAALADPDPRALALETAEARRLVARLTGAADCVLFCLDAEARVEAAAGLLQAVGEVVLVTGCDPAALRRTLAYLESMEHGRLPRPAALIRESPEAGISPQQAAALLNLELLAVLPASAGQPSLGEAMARVAARLLAGGVSPDAKRSQLTQRLIRTLHGDRSETLRRPAEAVPAEAGAAAAPAPEPPPPAPPSLGEEELLNLVRSLNRLKRHRQELATTLAATRERLAALEQELAHLDARIATHSATLHHWLHADEGTAGTPPTG